MNSRNASDVTGKSIPEISINKDGDRLELSSDNSGEGREKLKLSFEKEADGKITIKYV